VHICMEKWDEWMDAHWMVRVDSSRWSVGSTCSRAVIVHDIQ
jgi:hypothetical protein